jgi:alpha-2-macroglobulin
MSDNSSTPPESPQDQQPDQNPATAETPHPAAKRKLPLILITLLFTGLAVWAGNEYIKAQSLVSISPTVDISPEGGEIVLQYRHPVSRPIFFPTSIEVVDAAGTPVATNISTHLDSSKTLETIRFSRPTPFNRQLVLQRKNADEKGSIAYFLGLTPVPTHIEFSTSYEQVSLNDLLPTASQKHAPEALNNQIAIEFNGVVGDTYRKRVKFSPREVPFIKMSPLASGYYQWSDDKTLTFNFTNEKPRFDTRYQFNITPEKLINAEYQQWQGNTEIALQTSSNDVYVNDVSITDKVEWNRPVSFEFSGNMVGVFDLNKDKATDVMPVKMSPQVDGYWRWQNARTVTFTPGDDGWPIRAHVSIEFLPQVNQEPDRNWTNNRDLNRIEFFVKPRLQSISNINLRGNRVDPEAQLEVMFSRKLMDKKQLGHRQPLNDANAPIQISPAISGHYYWDEANRLIFEPDQPWAELTEYNVSIHPKFNPDERFEWSGTTQFSFTTAENVIRPHFFQIPENEPSGATFFGNKNQFNMTDAIAAEESLWFEFNRPFGKHHTAQTVTKGIKITPAIAGEYIWLSDYLLKFKPTDGWLPETTYQVKLTDALLYFHEQHYAENSSEKQFSVPQDNIQYQLKENYQPDQSLTLKFNKALASPLKMGRRYQASEVSTDYLPIQWMIKSNYEFEWTSANTLVLTPKPYWPANKESRFALNNNLLPRPNSHWAATNPSLFKTSANIVTVERINPDGQLSRNGNIEVRFSKKIKPDNVTIGAEDVSELVTIAPAVTGHWYWQAADKLLFKPDAPMAPSTDYTLTIEPKHISSREFTWYQLDDDKLPQPYISHFHTPYQRVQQSQALFEFDEQNPLKQRFLIDIELSEWTRFDELEKRFTLWTNNEVDGKTVEVPLIYKLTTEEPKDRVRHFRVVSDYIDRPDEDRRVYYQVEKGIPALGGNATMYADYRSDFAQEKPKFIRLKTVTYSRQDGRFRAHLNLSAPVEPEKLHQFLSIINTDSDNAIAYDLSVDSGSNKHNFRYLVEAEFAPHTDYRFAISSGLLAADGALTNKDISTDYQTPALERKVNFALKGNILSRYDAQNVQVLSSNRESFSLSIDQIYASNVRNYLNTGLRNRGALGNAGKQIYSERFYPGSIHHQKVDDVELTTGIDLSKFFRANPHGLYRIRLNSNSRWFLSSDIALIARRTDDAVYAWALSLSDAVPLANIKLELVDAWNQTVTEVRTDASGFAKLNNPNPKNTHILLASHGDDFSFLDFRTQQESFSGFDVTGVRSAQDASLLQAYLYGERGVYRPGDTLHLVGVVRDQDGALPTADSLILSLKDPTGAERFSERYAIDATGIVTLDYAIPADAKTGKWQAQLAWRGSNIGTLNYQVEEFIPNKIKVELSSTVKAALPGQLFKFAVQSNNLFGPAAAGRKVVGRISLRPDYFKPKGYGDYSFGHDDHRFQQLNTDLIETRLDDKGHHVYEYQVPEGIDSPIGLSLHYNATVIDDSGRGVAEYAQVPVHLFEQYVGVRRLASNTIERGDTVKFAIVNVTAEGQTIDPAQQSLKYEVFRKRKVTHFRKNERGYYRYVTEKVDVPLQNQVGSDNRFDYLTEYSGEHYLQVTDLNGGQVTRFYFNVVGPRDQVSIVEAPEAVLMKARQPHATVGETLQVDIQAPFAGHLLLIAERDEVMWTRSIDMSENTVTVSLPISAAQVPNIYLSAIVVQPAVQGSREQPVYASGLLNITVRDPSQNPSVQINAPARVSPNGKLTVEVSVDRLDQGDMYFTLAAVDEGILDLTRFVTPDMKTAFTRKQRLDVGHYSVYPWVVPYEPETLLSISPSGSAPSRALIKKKRENPDAAARVKSVALWSGLQRFGDNGKASVTFDVPEFDGSLRLMLVSFGDQRFNSAETTVTVRDDLVLKPALPRFMANGDHFEMPFTLFNSTEQSGDVTVSVEFDDKVDLLGNAQQNIHLSAGSEAQGAFSFNVKDQLGIVHFKLTANGLNEQTLKNIDVPVRSSGNYVSLSDSGIIDAGTPKTIQIPKQFKPGTETLGLRVAPAGLLEFTGSLQYLLRYPHGCLEQTTSKLFPLLYFEDFAKGVDFYGFRTSTPRYYLRKGIDKIERMQLENGYFSYWSGSDNVNPYAFLYAAHFMAEARAKGLDINETVWNNLQYRLRDDVLNRFDSQSAYNGAYNLSHQVYALYILALSDNPMVAEMNAVLEYQRDQLKAHDRARLAAAFKLAGRDHQAEALLSDITSITEYDNPYRQTAGTFASNTRDLAILLDALIEVDPQADVVPIVIDKLSSLRRHGRWSSTQDNAIALMALGKSIARSARTQNGDVIITLPNGDEVSNKAVELSTIDLLAGEVSIRTTKEAEANFYWQADGVSNAPVVSDDDHGLKIRRQYLNTKQQAVDLNSLHQGDLIIVKLTMASTQGTLHNIAVTDLLPMGLEIENARLSTSSDIPWLKSSAQPDYTDIRDDRLNLYLTLAPQEVVYYYTTRAVTVGNFAIPSIRAEAMYDESKYSLSGAGTMKVLSMQ